MCVNGKEMLLIDRFIIDMGMLSPLPVFPPETLYLQSPPKLQNLGT